MPKCTYRVILVDTDAISSGPYAHICFQREFEGEEVRRCQSYYANSLAQMERAKRVFNAVIDKALAAKKALALS